MRVRALHQGGSISEGGSGELAKIFSPYFDNKLLGVTFCTKLLSNFASLGKNAACEASDGLR